MTVYTLPNPTSCEQYIAQRVSRSKKETTFWKRFPSGELYVRLLVKAKRALVIGRTWGAPDHLWGTLLLVDTLHRNGVGDIILVLPYFAYARQDRQRLSGEPLSGLCLAKLFACSGAKKIITLDLHSKRVQEASALPLISMSFASEFANAIKKELSALSEVIVVAPDRGARGHADEFANALQKGKQCAWIEKVRDPYSGKVTPQQLHRLRDGTAAILFDDMLDTGKTIRESVHLLRKHGFKDFYLCITHPVFSGVAAGLIRSLGFKKIFVSDTIPLSPRVVRILGIHVVPAGPALGKAISQFLRM